MVESPSPRRSMQGSLPMPAEARRILAKLEFHYTPKHASWLNMAEIEISIMNRQCLDRRIDNIAEIRQEVAAWEK